MKLQEWLKAWPYSPVSHEDQSPLVVVPDWTSEQDDDIRRKAWRLEDYRVSSVSAGVIRFIPC